MTQTLNKPAAQILREVKLKVTPARIAILEVLSGTFEPLSANDIFESVRKNGYDQATVYRNIKSLGEKGIVRQVGLEHDHAHYELTPDNEHHHVICIQCGRVEEFVGCVDDAVIANALKQAKHFDVVDRHSFELFGRCKSCTQ